MLVILDKGKGSSIGNRLPGGVGKAVSIGTHLTDGRQKTMEDFVS
jgi:hypothetical protein